MKLCRKCIHWNECNKVGVKVGENVIAYLACERYDEGYKDGFKLESKGGEN